MAYRKDHHLGSPMVRKMNEDISVVSEQILHRNIQSPLRSLEKERKCVGMKWKMNRQKLFLLIDRETVLLKSCSINCDHCATDKLSLWSTAPSLVTSFDLILEVFFELSKPEVNKIFEIVRGSGRFRLETEALIFKAKKKRIKCFKGKEST